MGFKLSSSLKKKKFKKIQFRGASRIKRALLKTLDYLAVRTGNSVYHCALFMFIYTWCGAGGRQKGGQLLSTIQILYDTWFHVYFYLKQFNVLLT